MFAFSFLGNSLKEQVVNTWDWANSSCLKEGGHLPWLKNKQDIQWMLSQMEMKKLNTAWIGMRKSETNTSMILFVVIKSNNNNNNDNNNKVMRENKF